MRRLGSVGRFALWVLALLAFLSLTAGAAVAGFVGSDDTVFNRPTELGEGGRPVLTAPDLLAYDLAHDLPYDSLSVTLRASAPEGVFIAAAHPVDVADFVGDSTRVRLTSATPTGVVAEVVGTGQPVQPASAGFWTRSRSGSGVNELTLARGTSADQWVIAPLAGTGPTTVSVGLTVPGVYASALVAAGGGAALLLVCAELLLRARRRSRSPSGPPAGRARATARDRTPNRTPGGKRRSDRAAFRGATVVTLLVTLTGCEPEKVLPVQRQSIELASTKVALTRAELPMLLESYGARVRAAMEASRPPRPRIESWRLADRGPALESDLFGSRVAALTRLPRPGPGAVPTRKGAEVFSPRFDSYPMWSLVASRTGRGARLDVFNRSTVLAPWLRQAGTGLTRDLPTPARPTRSPGDAGATAAITAWSGYLRSGTRTDELVLDRGTTTWRENIADLGGRAMFEGYTITPAPVGSGGRTRVVRVEDGALAVVATRVTTRLQGRPDLRVGWAPPYGRYRYSADGVLGFAHLAVGVVHLPAEGPATLLGSTFSEVGFGR